jgi:hypothetical protein
VAFVVFAHVFSPWFCAQLRFDVLGGYYRQNVNTVSTTQKSLYKRNKRMIEGHVPKGVRVQVPPRAPIQTL